MNTDDPFKPTTIPPMKHTNIAQPGPIRERPMPDDECRNVNKTISRLSLAVGLALGFLGAMLVMYWTG